MKQWGRRLGIVCAIALVSNLGPTITNHVTGAQHDRGLNEATAATDRLIIKLRPGASGSQGPVSAAELRTLSAAAGVTLSYIHPMSGGAQVLKLPQRMAAREVVAIAQKVRSHPHVEYAEPDFIMRITATDDEGQFAEQWEYKAASIETGGIDLPGAWAVTTGSPQIVVAVVDSGVLPHADLVTNLLPGYDFVSEDPAGGFLTANDGDGRDSDATDPGDWITAEENAGKDATHGFFAGCGARSSTWHGTHVAGTIGATSRSGRGVVGVNAKVKILPVRAWGKCGGYSSDIVDGARWAAGLPVPNVPKNPNPAHVLNLSLDGPGTCSMSVQLAINEIIDAGKTVVVAAGNRNADAANFSPASCSGSITVGATNRAGGRASYSNFGSVVKISAPGGDTSASLENGVLSTANSGATVPLADDYGYKQGTSMAAPHVSGIIALMLSANPDLTPAQIIAIIQTTARPFPSGTGSDCTVQSCGAGIINAAAAVGQVSRILKTSAPSINFAATEVGQNTEMQDVTLTNTNRGNIPLRLGAVSVSGAHAADFTKSLDTCSSSIIAPGASCQITVIFHPSEIGLRSAQLVIPSSAVNSLNTALLTGTGQSHRQTVALAP